MTDKGTSLFILIFCVVFMGALFLPTGNADAEQQITLIYAGSSPSTGFTAIAMERWKKEVFQRTDAMVTISNQQDSDLMPATSILDRLAAGKADIACVGILSDADRFLVPGAVALPLEIPDARTGSAVFLAFYAKYGAQLFTGYKVLALFTSAPANLITTIPIEKPLDLRGMDLQASGTTAGLLAAWHANPVNIPSAYRQEALQKGIVKGMLTSLETLKDADYAGTCRFVTITNTVVYPFAVIMRQEKWDLLPDTAKQVMDALVPEQSQWAGGYIDRYAKEAVEWAAREHKTAIKSLSETQTRQLNQRLYNVTAAWIEKAKARGGIAGDAILADLKTMVAQYRQAQ